MGLQMPYKKTYPDNESYAVAAMTKLLSRRKQKGRPPAPLATRPAAAGSKIAAAPAFFFIPFPILHRWRAVNALVSRDLDGDGHPDIILAGNESQMTGRTGSEDASYGSCKERWHGNFTPRCHGCMDDSQNLLKRLRN